MGETRNIIIATLGFITIIIGGIAIFTDWYSFTGSTATLDNSTIFNATGSGHTPGYYTNYIQGWANSTASNLAIAQSIPYLGGAFMLLTGLFQGLVLAVGIPTAVILPLFQDIAVYLSIPTWAVAFGAMVLLISAIVAIANAMKGGSI